MSTLPERMRQAADTLIEANYRFTGCTKNEAQQMAEDKWSANKLRGWADQWEAQDAVVESTIEQLAQSICNAGHDVEPKANTWETASGTSRDIYRSVARSLYESGWRRTEANR